MLIFNRVRDILYIVVLEFNFIREKIIYIVWINIVEYFLNVF